jgi:hypothetical protein
LPEWRPDARGACGAKTLPVDDTFEFEAGNSPDANVRQFEAMIWPLVIANEGGAYNQNRDQVVLHGRLRLDELDGKKRSVVLCAGSSQHWRDVARRVTTVAFIEMSGAGNNGILIDEYALAHRISDFLKKCPSKDGFDR